MEVKIFLKGMILGLFIAAPVKPIGVLCIQRTLKYGKFSGFFSGLGAALADGMYAMIAVFGLAFLSHFFSAKEFVLEYVGGFFLIYLGWRSFFAKTSEEVKIVSHRTLLRDFASTFFLTVINPLTIFTCLVIFADCEISSLRGNHHKFVSFVVGVFLGSFIWWFFLSEGVLLFRRKISQKVLNRLKIT